MPSFGAEGDWKIIFEHDMNAPVLGVIIKRMKGPYATTSFAKYREHAYGWVPKETILCLEPKALYGNNPGQYCKTIVGGKKLAYSGASTVLYSVTF